MEEIQKKLFLLMTKMIIKNKSLMRKIVFLLGILLVMGVSMTRAQSSLQRKLDIGKRHELYFGVGLLNLYVIDKHDKLTKPIPYDSEFQCFAIPVHIGIDYKYRLSKRFSVGASIGITDSAFSNYVNSDDVTDLERFCGDSSLSCMYALPAITYTWFISGYGIFRAYSGAGLGLALLKEKVTVPGFECNRTKADLGYNVTLVGMSLGGESFRYFCEWNAGCKSMLTAGLLVRF